MNDPVVYDKAKWHTEGSWPAGLADSQSFVHTGLFLGWLIDHNMVSEEFAEDNGNEIQAFKQRRITGPRLFQTNDGVLVDDMLSAEGNAFAQSYFDFETGDYLRDYDQLLSHGLVSQYHVQDTWENYDTLKSKIDERYADWKKYAS